MSDFHTKQQPFDRLRRREMDACLARDFLARTLAWEISLASLRTDEVGPDPAEVGRAPTQELADPSAA